MSSEAASGSVMRRTPTHYERLKVSPSASADELRRAYRAMAMRWHPDRLRKVAQEGGPAVADKLRRNAAESMALINAAYDVLRDPEKRHAYDVSLYQVGAQTHPAAARGHPTDVDRQRASRAVHRNADHRRKPHLAPHWVGLGLALCSLLLFTSGWALYRTLNEDVELELAMRGGLPTLAHTAQTPRHVLDGDPLPLATDEGLRAFGLTRTH
jgi:DnaJ domain